MGFHKPTWDELSYDVYDIIDTFGTLGNLWELSMAACLSANIPLLLV